MKISLCDWHRAEVILRSAYKQIPEDVLSTVTPHLNDRNKLKEMLIHGKDENVRVIALTMCSLYHDFSPDTEFSEIYLDLAVNEPSETFRECILIALGRCYYGSNDRRIGRVLAEIAVDTKLTDNLRFKAYSALVAIFREHHLDEHIRVLCRTLDYDISSDIDWVLVAQYL